MKLECMSLVCRMVNVFFLVMPFPDVRASRSRLRAGRGRGGDEIAA